MFYDLWLYIFATGEQDLAFIEQEKVILNVIHCLLLCNDTTFEYSFSDVEQEISSYHQ